MTSVTRRALIALMAAAAAMAAPAWADPTGPRQISHILGTTEITGKPQRIVALEFSFVQALDGLGVLPVGIADDDKPDRIELLLGRKIDYASVGTRLEPNLELVSALTPDLIIADRLRHSAIYDQLGRIAPTIVLNSWEGDYDTLTASFQTIADAVGEPEKGAQALAAHQARMAGFKAQIPAGENRRFLLAVATPDSMSLHTANSFVGTVLAALGLTPAVEGGAKPVESGAGMERVIAVNPDVLLVAADVGGTVLDQWQTNPAWQNVAAVRNGMVFEVNRNQFSRFRGLRTAELIAQEVLSSVYGIGN